MMDWRFILSVGIMMYFNKVGMSQINPILAKIWNRLYVYYTLFISKLKSKPKSVFDLKTIGIYSSRSIYHKDPVVSKVRVYAFSIWLMPNKSTQLVYNTQREYDIFAITNKGRGEIAGCPKLSLYMRIWAIFTFIHRPKFLLACGGVLIGTEPKWKYEYAVANDPVDGLSRLSGFRWSSDHKGPIRIWELAPNHKSVSFDSKASGTADGASLTFAHTVVSATNGAIAAFFHTKTSGGTQSATYNGNALTQRDTQDVEDWTQGMFDLVPQSDTGAHNIVMSLSGAVDSLAGASIAMTGVHQVTPRSVTNKSTGSSTTPNLTLAGGDTNELALTAVGWHDNPINTIDPTWTTGNIVASGSIELETAYKTGAASVTRTDSVNNSTVWGMMGVSYKAATARYILGTH